jgi:hypothetical protein
MSTSSKSKASARKGDRNGTAEMSSDTAATDLAGDKDKDNEEDKDKDKDKEEEEEEKYSTGAPIRRISQKEFVRHQQVGVLDRQHSLRHNN